MQEGVDGARARKLDVRLLLVALAVSLGAANVWLLNVTAYPSFNDFFPLARDIATTFGGLVSLGCVYVGMRRPRFFYAPTTFAAALVFISLGALGMFWASSVASPFAATFFACLRSLGSSLGSAYLICSLLDCDLRSCLVVLVCGYAGKYVWMAALWLAPNWLRCAALVIFGLVNVTMLYLCARPTMDCLAKLAPSESLDVTNPSSFVPFTSGVFVTILLFHAAFGFAITYGSVNSYPQPTIVAFVAFVLVMGIVLVRGSTQIDLLFLVAFGFALLGMLLVMAPVSGELSGSLANAFLQAGSEVTTVVVDLLVVMVASRNRAGLLPVLFSTGCAGAFGTELGAMSGHLENYLDTVSPELAFFFAVAIAFSFAVYNVALVHDFSFDVAVTEVRPAAPVAELDEGDERLPAIDGRVGQLVTERALTPREAEVFALLAHGRNAAYIQESLTISRNTVKSYVARVYGKLGVHSHQELIDLVEGE